MGIQYEELSEFINDSLYKKTKLNVLLFGDFNFELLNLDFEIDIKKTDIELVTKRDINFSDIVFVSTGKNPAAIVLYVGKLVESANILAINSRMLPGGYISKPYSTKEVSAILTRLIKNKIKKIYNEEFQDYIKQFLSVKNLMYDSLNHDIKNLTHAVTAFAKLAIKKSDNKSDVEKMAKNILKASEKYIAFTDSVLKPESRDDSYIDLNNAIDEIIEFLSPAAAAKNVTVDVNHAGSMSVFGKKEDIERIVLNLISNAIKYSFDNGRVSVVVSQNKINECSIIIKDEGIGIPEDEIDSIFIPYNKSSKTKDRKDSTGIGLYTCKTLVEQMGGTISVKSEKGSTFCVQLTSKHKNYGLNAS